MIQSFNLSGALGLAFGLWDSFLELCLPGAGTAAAHHPKAETKLSLKGIRDLPKIRVPSLGVLIIRILLLY